MLPEHLWPLSAAPVATWMGPINGVKSNVFASLKKGRKGAKAHPGQLQDDPSGSIQDLPG